ncbi:hypothetical protein HS041_33330 [Planomonospora sp. ID67723]|uniref:hypothetical protein n=1 Tax=Planomonospora sp. ID67723 TaxID=2738134 RepID=UPI0018C3652B|nr:hypothetical protein [Planomonospora sp. ID67723]MBG0832582.1 hypothetical protein [Planomonospora sp. ID67723]
MTDRPWSWNEEELARFAAAARVGDLHAILDVPPDDDLQAALQRDDAREYRYGWERLLALHLAKNHFGHAAEGVIYDYAEFRYFVYDDDGYVEQRLNTDLAMLHSVHDFGLHDPQQAYTHWQAALRGPYPEGAREEFAKIEPLLNVRTRSRLAPLMAA